MVKVMITFSRGSLFGVGKKSFFSYFAQGEIRLLYGRSDSSLLEEWTHAYSFKRALELVSVYPVSGCP